MKRILCVLLAAVLLAGCSFIRDVLAPRSKTDYAQPPHQELRYFLSKLQPEDYENLCAYYDAAMNFESSCKLPNPVSTKQVEAVISLLHYECPELMMVDLTQYSTMYTVNGLVAQVDIPLIMDKDEYDLAAEKTRAVVADLVGQCAGLPDVEKEQLIYEYIVTNCVYDSNAPLSGTAYGCLVLGRAKCDGISGAMKWVLEECGIACITLAGDPADGSVGHAWNVVCIDSVWYDVDATADVGQGQASYPAYNVSDSWIRNKYILDTAFHGWGELPGTDTMDGSYHSLRGSYVKAGAPDHLEELYENAFENGGSFVLQFEDSADLTALEQNMESRLEKLGNKQGWSKWGWSILTVPGYNTIRITPEK